MPFIYATTIALFATFGSTALAETISGTASVIDDDTFEIHGERIRLNAIDAIKSGQQCFLPECKVWSCGRDAAFALSDKIGRRVLECRVKDIDRYGR